MTEKLSASFKGDNFVVDFDIIFIVINQNLIPFIF